MAQGCELSWIGTWDDALTAIGTLNGEVTACSPDCTAGTYDDWRLPNLGELASLVHIKFDYTSLGDTSWISQWTSGNPFLYVYSAGYWSSTEAADLPDYVWYVSFDNARVRGSLKTISSLRIWQVRGGP